MEEHLGRDFREGQCVMNQEKDEWSAVWWIGALFVCMVCGVALYFVLIFSKRPGYIPAR